MLLRMTTTSLKEMILVALTFVLAISGQNHYIDQVRGEAKIMIKQKVWKLSGVLIKWIANLGMVH